MRAGLRCDRGGASLARGVGRPSRLDRGDLRRGRGSDRCAARAPAERRPRRTARARFQRRGRSLHAFDGESMSTTAPGPTRRLTAVLRQDERVTPLELFFDLVFVLALTQCTALMSATPTWKG